MATPAEIRANLIEWVQARIDELSDVEQTQNAGSGLIERELDVAAQQTTREVRKQLVYPAGEQSTLPCLVKLDPYEVRQPTRDEAAAPYSIISVLPSTFARFLRARVSGWIRPTDDLISADVQVYRHQRNENLRASIREPIAALIPFYHTVTDEDSEEVTTYTQAIEFFPAPQDLAAFSSQFSRVVPANSGLSSDGMAEYRNLPGASAIVPELLIVNDKAAELYPSSLHDAIVWLCAGRVLTALRQGGIAEAAYANYNRSRDIIKLGMKGEDVIRADMRRQQSARQ